MKDIPIDKCPFCGSMRAEIIFLHREQESFVRVAVECPACFARGPAKPISAMSGYEAVKAWNDPLVKPYELEGLCGREEY